LNRFQDSCIKLPLLYAGNTGGFVIWIRFRITKYMLSYRGQLSAANFVTFGQIYSTVCAHGVVEAQFAVSLFFSGAIRFLVI